MLCNNKEEFNYMVEKHLWVAKVAKIFFLFTLFFLVNAYSVLYPQNTTTVVPEAISQIETLLNKPAMICPAIVTPLGRNWFRMETDFHAFTDQASLQQVASTLLDLDNVDAIYDGKRSKMTASIVNRTTNEVIVDFISVFIGPFGIQFKTPYRASVRNTTNTDTKVVVELRQTLSDNSSNNDVKNLYSTKYAEEVTIGGKKFIYIRAYTIYDANAFIIPGAKRMFEKEAGPSGIEGIQMILDAAKRNNKFP